MAKLGLKPFAEEGEYYYGTFPESSLMALAGYLKFVVAVVREKEGITVVFDGAAKEGLRLYSEKEFEGPFALISFGAQTSLSATGITAAASSALAKEKIPANFLAGFYHDCVLVPYASKEKALKVLSAV
jgi:hypothetical protein